MNQLHRFRLKLKTEIYCICFFKAGELQSLWMWNFSKTQRKIFFNFSSLHCCDKTFRLSFRLTVCVLCLSWQRPHTHYSLFLFLVSWVWFRHAFTGPLRNQHWPQSTWKHFSFQHTSWFQLGTVPFSRPNLTSALSLCSRLLCADGNEIKAGDWGLDHHHHPRLSFMCTDSAEVFFYVVYCTWVILDMFNCICSVCETWTVWCVNVFILAHVWKDMRMKSDIRSRSHSSSLSHNKKLLESRIRFVEVHTIKGCSRWLLLSVVQLYEKSSVSVVNGEHWIINAKTNPTE